MDAKKNISREQLFDYMQDRCTEDEARQVRIWLMNHLNDPSIDQLFNDLLDAAETEYDPAGKERVRRKLDSFIAACTPSEHRVRARRYRTMLLRAIEYAAVVVCLALTFHYRHQAATPREWVEVCTAMGEQRQIVLPDSTRIWLNAGSKLIYPKEFNGALRQIYLSGELFADVRRDEKRPFIVSVDRLQIEVLGTQFNLKSYVEDGKAEVSLVKGSVSVNIRAAEMDGRLTLSPGDMLRYDKTSRHIDMLHFAPESYRNWRDNNDFFFVDQTLADIVADLHRHFDVDIIITDKALGNEIYYASFINNESLDRILEALNKDRLFSIRREKGIYYLSEP